MNVILCLLLTLLSTDISAATTTPEQVIFNTRDGGVIHADYYPTQNHTLILGHGAIFNKESWRDLAQRLVAQNIGVLAIDFRGYGQSKGGNRPMDRVEDILAAIAYLQQRGVQDISVLGASMGGGIAGAAATQAKSGEISRLILLSPAPISNPEQMQADKILYVASSKETGIAAIEEQYERAPEPKQLKLLDGNAHAQHIFKTTQKNALTDIIIQFLLAR